MRSKVRGVLRLVFAKPDMAVSLEGRGVTGDFASLRLTPEDIYGGGLTIHLSGNVVQLARFPGEEFSCHIDYDRFSDILIQLEPRPRPNLEESRSWLSSCVAAGEPTQSKAAYVAEARNRFRVSERSFLLIWKEEVKKAQMNSPNTKWGKGGRPKGRQKS
jgi:hypothetical protein